MSLNIDDMFTRFKFEDDYDIAHIYINILGLGLEDDYVIDYIFTDSSLGNLLWYWSWYLWYDIEDFGV